MTTRDGWILIATPEEWLSVGVEDDYPADGQYRLVNDITLSQETYVNTFYGILEGDGHTVTLKRAPFVSTVGREPGYDEQPHTAILRNLTFYVDFEEGTGDYGHILCSWCYYSEFRNITFLGPDVNTQGSFSFVYYASDSVFSHVINHINVVSTGGGIVTMVANGSYPCDFWSCANHGDFSAASSYAYGICGDYYTNNFVDCANYGTLRGYEVAGIARNGSFRNCGSYGSLIAEYVACGIATDMMTSKKDHPGAQGCWVAADITSQSGSAYGIAKSIQGESNMCYLVYGCSDTFALVGNHVCGKITAYIDAYGLFGDIQINRLYGEDESVFRFEGNRFNGELIAILGTVARVCKSFYKEESVRLEAGGNGATANTLLTGRDAADNARMFDHEAIDPATYTPKSALEPTGQHGQNLTDEICANGALDSCAYCAVCPLRGTAKAGTVAEKVRARAERKRAMRGQSL